MTKKKRTDTGIAYQDMLSKYFSIRPKTVESLNNDTTFYYYEWLTKKIFGVYKLLNIPDGWDIDYIKERLFLDGKICITDTALGVLPLRCGVAGINVFEHPTTCVIANPVLGNLERTIGVNCALVKLQYNYKGIGDILRRYATMLALCDAAVSVNLFNTKVSVIFGAETKAEAESFKMIFDKISEGSPAVFTSDSIVTKLKDRVVFADTKNQFIAQDVQNLKQSIINDFLSEVGINNANTEKRERLVTNEVGSNRQEVRSGAEHWLETINEGLTEGNKLYNLNLKMVLADWNEVQNNESSQSFDA